MILKNTWLLLKLYFSPLSTMSRIIDEGSWLYSAVAVAAVSILLQFTVTRYIYSSYEAVPVKQQFYHSTHRFDDDEESEKEYEKYHPPRQTTRQLPLPVVGNLGWFFLSFSPFSTLISILSLALLYIPFTIFVMSFFESMGSLDVSLKRDYGPLFVCTLMSWAAA